MTAVIYARYSSDNQREESIEGQIRECTAYAEKNGVHLISVMEPIAEGSQGILVETLLEGMAEYYSAELSEKVIRGQTENALKGKCTVGTLANCFSGISLYQMQFRLSFRKTCLTGCRSVWTRISAPLPVARQTRNTC